jgi:hypothetical protein
MIRVHEVVSRGGEAVLSDNRSNSVSGCFERAMHSPGRNVVGGGEVLDPDGAVGQVVRDPRL